MASSVAAELSQRWPALFKEKELTQGKVYQFPFQSIQSYLSALYVAVNYEPSKGNVLHYTLAERAKQLFKSREAQCDMHKTAVDKALRSKKGKYDFFLIFLIGISAGPSYKDLSCFLPDLCERGNSEKIVPYILKKMQGCSALNESLTLVRCLDELNLSYILGPNKVHRIVQDSLMPSEWSDMAKTLLNSEDQQQIFDLKEYPNSEMAFARLLPVVKNSRVLRICECSEMCWMLLATALRSPSNNIKEIDIDANYMSENEKEFFFGGLKSSNCKVEILRLPYFPKHNDTETYPPILGLLSNPSHLRELDLKHVIALNAKTKKALATLLVMPGAHLEKLVAHDSSLSADFFQNLATALRSSMCNLKELDLKRIYKYNDEEKILPLSEALGDPCCHIRVLRLANCFVGQTVFTALVSAFSLNPSHLKELDLSYSTPGLEAFSQFCSLLEDSRFKLETLILIQLEWWDYEAPAYTCTFSTADLRSKPYKALASALSSSHLRVLDLSFNYLDDSSVECLSAGLANPACKLEILRFESED
uniref:NACHT LRR and PYD domain-containing protein n=1 Tax=Astyanax mexicanus TaxID=7994 RepID=A0A8B9R7P3_ASTMX